MVNDTEAEFLSPDLFSFANEDKIPWHGDQKLARAVRLTALLKGLQKIFSQLKVMGRNFRLSNSQSKVQTPWPLDHSALLIELS